MSGFFLSGFLQQFLIQRLSQNLDLAHVARRLVNRSRNLPMSTLLALRFQTYIYSHTLLLLGSGDLNKYLAD